MINLFFKTYGCQANVADSAHLQSFLGSLGVGVVESEIDADLIIINSCAIRDKAEQKMFSYVGQLADLKRKKPYLRIGVIGCVASYKKDELFSRFDHINFVHGSREEIDLLKEYLSNVVESIFSTKSFYEKNPTEFENKVGQDRDIKKILDLRKSRKSLNLFLKNKFNPQKIEIKQNAFKKSFVNIMTGCNNYCSYCIVPFVRGIEKSYEMDAILMQVKTEVDSGAKEITLIGQNVNSYCDPKTGANFAALLENVAKIPGEFWVRFISPHPKDMSEDVLKIMQQYQDKLCSYIHLPIQSGSNRVLQAMNRPYTKEHFLKLVDTIRKYLPQATVSTDIIVGFPGEEENDFLETFDVVQKCKFDMIYSFIYSPRRYTKAFAMKDDCPNLVKLERLEKLQAMSKKINLENNLKHVGKVLKVLVESEMENGNLAARTTGNILVSINDNKENIGKFVNVKIIDAHVANLDGQIV
ncbi:TPA: tRNA (N6-isopentenyl adenosine(37)-C2)-methylthiotransferase MiaB [Candidatus Dependentiae bacterium]|nr:MAG: (Dimethylallyl)adenosine tRNA methylthiotransferase MiaB [candidate division TM6 bacterium GW2011_GWE2_31_21]KKP52995.1 MAG: (Dimethylallyl)adenosine tRNA methylthiotransferase MiaB [candidate division TM6 bacterium GW2011_GWF2_33_332]HBS47767.1 tRNA (N6-isopentenyl adenosine(37)-C2)-methylthiotransferase MiaB [Candidatus Dependentiae bacterium]HBZ73257.1 tRNA (N6-isopentenyl adenosine(37)-C2)-methylthiotransferase MiaB [Candidatus Dependentiae bacterium]